MTEYLKSIDDNTLRAAILEAIRQAVQHNRPGSYEVDRQKVVNIVLHSLVHRPGLFWGPGDIENIQKNLLGWYSQCSRPNTQPYAGRSDVVGEQDDNRRIESVFWELFGRGLLYPRLQNARVSNQPRIPPHVIESMYLTPLGERYFKTSEELHPGDSSFVSKVFIGTPTLTTEIKTALEEAQACFQHRLLRSSVINLGLAYEAMAAEVFDVVVADKRRPREAREVLEKIEAAMRAAKDEAGLRAVRVADEIRTDRNLAAHSWATDFADVAHVETLLIMGARNVGPFWGLTGR